MPRTPIDYSKSCIYKICCKDTSITDIYVGSTTCMRRRKSSHKTACNNENNKHYHYNVYQFIRDNGGWDNWDMVLVEKVNVNDGDELGKEERKWIEQLNAILNKNIPTRTRKEYYKEYRENNKDKLKEYYKEYSENNKKEILEYQKQHYKNNKEKILKKIECPICQCVITKQHLKRHQKSKKCLESQNKI